MSAAPDPVLVRPSEPETLDRATVVAVDRDGSIVGRATLSRLYGLRAEIQIELAPTTTIALALIDGLEREARKRRLVRLELDAHALPESTTAVLRRWRPMADERRGPYAYLTWPTTLVTP
ncbi:MAG TPA: hypothetical protein VF080_02055 [Solirubrobacteraceae bacterium]